MKPPALHRTVTLAASLLAPVAVLTVAAWGYWQYVTAVPALRLNLPPMPEPNGYERAIEALGRVGWADRPPMPDTWPDGTTAQLEAQITSMRPVLDEVRAALALEWRHPPEVSLYQPAKTFPGYATFREGARLFAAEAILTRRRGDPGASMSSSLDAMEMAAKIPLGGGLTARLTAMAIHVTGYREGRQVALLLPADAARTALQRVRRIRATWPPLWQMWEAERLADHATFVESFQLIRREPIHEQLRVHHEWEDPPNIRNTLERLLTPRRHPGPDGHSLSATDR